MFYRLLKPPAQVGQWVVALTACCTALTCGQGFSWSSPAIPMIRSGTAGFSLTEDEESWMVTATFIGNLASPIPAGYIMDYVGRKNILLLFDVVAILSWIIIYFSYSALGLYIARFLIGIWCGIVYTVVPVFIGEVVTANIRGSMVALFCVSLYVGGLYESIIAIFFSYHTITILSSLPPILIFVLLLFLPESPYFYLMKGNRSKASKSMDWLRGSYKMEELDLLETCVKRELENKGSFLDILKKKSTRKAFFIVQTLGILQRAAGLSVLFSFVSIIVPDSWVTADQSFIVLSISWIIGSISSSIVMPLVGRKILILISASGAGITMACTAIWFYLRDFTYFDTTSTEMFPLIFLFINGLCFSFGLVSIPNMIQGELFPVNVKGKASASVCVMMSLASGVTVRIFQPITKVIGIYFIFVIFSLSCTIVVFFTIFFLIETRGKSLEEIQQTLTEGKIKCSKKENKEVPNNYL